MDNGQSFEEIDLRDLFRILIGRKWLILLVVVLAVASAIITNNLTTPIYEASTTVLLKNEGGIGAMAFLTGGAEMGRDARNTYVEILKSRSLALAAAERLGLDYTMESEELDRLRKSITVQPVQSGDIIRVSVQSPDPHQAVAVSNALVEALQDYSRDRNQLEARSAREFIGEQIALVSEDLYRAEEELKNFKEEKGVLLPAEVSTILARLSQLQAQKAEAEVGVGEAQVRLKQLRERLSDEQREIITSTTISVNPLVQQFRSRLAQLETELAAALETYTEKHPSVVALRSKIDSTKAQMESEVENIITAQTRARNPIYLQVIQQIVELEVEATALQARSESLQGIIADYEEQLRQLPETELTLARLTREKMVAEELYLLLATRHEEMKITEAMEPSSVQVLDPAIPPRSPIKPRKMLNLAISGVLGVFVGVGLALLLDFLDMSVKTEEDIRRLLDVPVLGQIPDLKHEVKRSGNR
ncbi:MAG: hypothetical protein GX030_08300 [Firmicutes bacterium]|nr:hypothetical protein [Bacillota bacterium]